jgi:gliding motility-associated-like protein
LDTLSVSVNPSPVLSSTKTPNAVCSGSLFSYTPTSATPSTTFSWSRALVSGISNPTNIGTGAISETLLNTTTNPIFVTYVYTLTANTCSKTDTVRVRINPLPTALITAPRNYFCIGDSVLLTADTFSKYTFQWRFNTTAISGATSRFLQAKAIGNYDVVVTDSNGCIRTSSIFNIVSKPNPTTKIDTLGPVSVCIGGSIALRADTLAKARFQWFRNGISLSADTNRFISALSAGNYTYRVVDSNGCSSISSPTAVFFNNIPNAAASALGSTNFCQGSSATLMSNISPGSTYQWRKNNVDIAGENTIWYTATTTGGYTVKVCNGGCCVVSNTIMVNADTPPIATITPSTLQNLCAGSTATLTASSGVGYTYQWQVNGIPIAGATNATYIVSDSGNYTCNITKGACTVAPPTVRVEIRPIPPIPFNIGNKTYCQGDLATPVTASANLGNILKWYTVPTGGVGTTTAPIPSTSIPDTIKYYVVQVNAFNCESPRVLLTIIVNPTPLKPIVANISYCQGDIAIPLTASLTTGDTLLWYNVASGGVGSTIAPTPSTLSVGIQLFYVSQKTKLGCEGPRDTIRVTIKPTPSFPIVNDIVYCQNYPAVPLSATLTTGDTLLWYTNAIGGVGSKIAPTPSTTTVGTFFFYVSQKTSLSCEGPRDTIKVTVNPTPLAPNASNVTYCQGDSSVPLTATLTSDTLLWYTSATGGTALYIAFKPSTAVAGIFKFYVSQKNTFGCESPRKEITVTINPTPKAPKVANIDYCQGQVVGKLTAIADPGNILLWYTTATGGVGDTSAPTPSTVDTGITTYYVSQKTALGCESPRDSIKVQINFKGKIAPTTRDTTYCQWQKVDTLTAVAFFGNTLLWYADSTTTTSFVSSPKPNTAIVGIVDYYVSQITSKGCESPRALLRVFVNPTPIAPITQSISYCQGILSDSLVAIVTPGNVLIWYADSIGGLGSTLSPSPSTIDTGIFVYYVSQRNKFGCESPRAALNVRIFAPHKDTIQITNCVKITYKNKSYFSPSVVGDTIKSFRGCDSIYRTAFLNVLLSDTVRLSICAYGQTYQYNGTFLGSSGIYQFKSKKINGCDSVVILDLKLQEVDIINIDTNVCGQFNYNGNTYNQSTRLPKDTILSIYGCDSVHRFYNFIVSKPTLLAGEIIEKCDSIFFRNNWYFASTNIEDTIKKQAFPFCDSIYILNQLNVIYRAPIQIYANPDTVIIEGDTVELYATSANTYKWSTGSTSDMIRVYPMTSTTYTITVSDANNCLNSDEIFIRVKKDDSEVSLPNAFSPNGDFINDVFKPDFYGKATVVRMMVFNRWGEKVYEGAGNYSAWDGTYFGEMQPSGVYSYYILYKTTVSQFEKKGTVTLIR